MIHTAAVDRWIGTARIDRRIAEQILAHAKEQVQNAITDSVHPLLAAQTFLACLLACFEGCGMPRAQRREFILDFLTLLEPVIEQEARTWAPQPDGVDVAIT